MTRLLSLSYFSYLNVGLHESSISRVPAVIGIGRKSLSNKQTSLALCLSRKDAFMFVGYETNWMNLQSCSTRCDMVGMYSCLVLIVKAKSGGGPVLCMVYRHLGYVGETAAV
jgi:hypothetical protein